MAFIARHLSPVRSFALVCAAVLLWGYYTPLKDLITPERGLGYMLGIIGGSMMLLVVVYPARKRMESLRFLGTIPFWFEAHMVLGIVGPILVLFHSKFSLGATNSNVALYCMLLVSGSGIIGRYFYSRVYDQLLGRQATVGEVQGVADRLRQQTSTVEVLPELMAAVEREEQWLLAPANGTFSRFVHPFIVGMRAAVSRAHLRRFITRAVAATAHQPRPLTADAERLVQAAFAYGCRRLDAQRRVAEYRLYANLFSCWHILHVPMFIMLIIAGTVHIISVHVY
jgi:hypothetical protein